MQQPLLQVIDLVREFDSGGVPVKVLKNINLSIMPGEMAAVVGASGSGKSTLMNILGCLDRPSSGRYLVNGEDTAQMPPDELARLRREYFGFIFQRYHLLGDLSARENVAVPAVYAGQQPGRRLARADALLARLGLAERTAYRPPQLSGGQQQRVSIARALMNGGEVILADEPTGALDSKSGREVMQILKELHSEGHTVIIVTHDMEVARNCRRIIEIRDGEIIADKPNRPPEESFRQPETLSQSDSGKSAEESFRQPETFSRIDSGKSTEESFRQPETFSRIDSGKSTEKSFRQPETLSRSDSGADAEKPFRQPETPEKDTPVQMQSSGSFAALDRLREAAKMASISIIAHKMRSFLTMLGIIIGIASVVSVVALGNGSKEQILKSISSIGTNTLTIFPGVFGERRSGRIRTLTVADADFIAKQGFVDSVTPAVFKSATLRYGNIAVNGQISGVGAQHFQVRGIEIVQGRGFDGEDENANATVAVIDQTAKETLFPDLSAQESAIGRVILVNNMPVRVVAVGEADAHSNSSSLSVWMPYTTVMGRLLGQSHISNITVRLKDGVPAAAAEETITRILTQRHGTVDFSVMNSDSIRRSVEEATATMTLLISMIAVISLIVGGIGVMNIMLVSVTERTQEIGVRMAVGARRSDILQQFLIEAVFICLIGGIGGILLALAFGGVFSHLSTDFPMIFSGSSMISAFLCATAIGIVFGYLPARNAARLDPVAALSRE